MSSSPTWNRHAARLAFAASLLAANISPGEDSLRDPTQPPDFAQTTPALEPSKDLPFLLSAILVAEGRRVAVINGTPLRRGDRVDNAEVESILQDRVILRTQETELVLELVPDLAKIDVKGLGK